MKRSLIIIVFLAFILGSCAHGISPYEAANGKAKCGKTYIK
jgi:PBP1b-binding outer membrane lipoprotein LpoB